MTEARTLKIESAVPSVQRGGSTVFFNPEHLLAYPQTLARVGNLYVRRSDMLTAMLMRDQMGLNVVMHAAAGVRHDRSFTTPSRLEDATLLADILGYALYRSASDLMAARPATQRREPLLAWSRRDMDDGLMDAPWPPVYPKQPNEPPRVAPSRAKADPDAAE